MSDSPWYRTVDTNKEVYWCDDCSKWHVGTTLCLGLLRKAKRSMDGEELGPQLPNPARPWKRIKDE